MNNIEIAITFLSSLAAVIALGLKLYQVIRQLVEEKKYSKLFETVAEAMIHVEGLSELSGEEKKARVMELTKESASRLGVESFDPDRISDLIESIIRITKKVNSADK